MSGLLKRILVAVICVVLFWALVGPVCRIIGLHLDADVLIVVRVCVTGLAALYILRPWIPPTA